MNIYLVLFVPLLWRCDSLEVLNNLPVTFKLLGNTNYQADSSGANLAGYIIEIGYSGSSWIAIQFMSSGLINDVLVLQIDDFFTTNSNNLFSGHQITYTDYYNNNSQLTLDTIKNNTKSAYGYSLTKTYSLSITRFIDSNGGEDWDAKNNKYGVINVCFYTSTAAFDPTTYRNSIRSCYYYEVDNLISTFIGTKLKSMIWNGYSTTIFGWIDGPSLTSNVYFYQNTPLFTYVKVPAVAIEIGTALQGSQDFYVWSPTEGETGDYFGSTVLNMTQDNTALGFNDNSLNLKHWNAVPASQINSFSSTSLRITFSRLINTYDQYDKVLLSTFIFCLYIYTQGSITSALTNKACEIVELSTSYVQMPINP